MSADLHPPAGPAPAAEWSGLGSAPDTPGAPTRPAPHRPAPRPAAGGLGLGVSPGGLLQDQLIQRQVGDRPPQAGVLLLQLLQPLGLIHLQPVVLLPPAVVGLLSHPQRPAHLPYTAALRQGHLGFPEFVDDLLDGMLLPGHPDLLSQGPTLTLELDRFWGVRAIGLAVIITGEIAGDGESNWLEGVQLISVYIILAIVFYFLPEAKELLGH